MEVVICKSEALGTPSLTLFPDNIVNIYHISVKNFNAYLIGNRHMSNKRNTIH